ncbi:MAG TPA: trypsin-like peptidase domain-containing protein [Candidatus Hydrogenedentes bacterium]|nr:trypsin-like peptidase domain-containing protein [Candidatus Hydrogenedentota bacterium]
MKRLLLFILLFLVAVPAKADAIADSRRNAIVTAIERAAPAVVSINVSVLRAQRRLPPMFDEFWGLFDMPRPMNQIEKRRMNSVGSGFFLNSEGYIVTNYHVIEDADEVVSVTLPDGRELPVAVVGADERTDIAVLRVKETSRVPNIPLGDSEDLLTGEWVIAIGNPFGMLMKDPQPTVSVGVISANHRRVSSSIGNGERLYQGMIQTDAAINPGNSGGPLVNASGQVVGVNTMIFSQSGGSVGLGFAIPINRARRVAEEIIHYGRRRDPWAGFKVEDVQSLPPALLVELGVRAESGCLVRNILRTAPAYEAGLRPGDVVTAINGQRVDTASDIDFVLWDLFIGDRCTLNINRQGKDETIRFAIEELSSAQSTL